MISRIDHISLAVRDYDKAYKFFSELLGLIPGASGGEEKSGFFWQLFSAGDLSRFELITPTSDKSFLNGFLSSRDGGVHHVTFQVPDIKQASQQLDKMKIPYFGYNDKYNNWKELFIHPRDAFGLLIQFSEFNAPDWLDESQNISQGKRWEVSSKNNKILLNLVHPGGGKVQNEFTVGEIDNLIADLSELKKDIIKYPEEP